MKCRRSLLTLAFVALMLGLPGCATTFTPAHIGEYFSDATITARVKLVIFGEPGLKLSDISVETFKGAVHLSGFVGTQDDISRVTKLVRAISGVTAVDNDLREKGREVGL